MAGDNKQTTTATSEPYAAAKPLLDWSMGQGMDLAKQGQLGKPLTMSTVVPYANQSTQAFDGMMNTAQGATGQMGQGLTGLSNMIGSGGYGAGGTSAAAQNLSGVARGDFLNGGDPNFQNVMNQATGRAADSVNLMASSMGRSGSGANQGVLAREVGDLSARMLSDQYNKERGYQMQATGMIDDQRNTANNNVLNSIGMLPGAYQAAQSPYDTMRNVGGAYEDLYGRQLNDQLRIAQETRDAPLTNIQQLLGIASGAGQYGNNTQTAQMPSNTMSQALGYGLGGLSLLRGL